MTPKNAIFAMFLLFIFLLTLATCNRSDDDPTITAPDLTPPTESSAQGRAFLESLQVAVLESFPVQVQATISGNLSDGCTTIVEIPVQRQNNVFLINVVTARDEQLACTQALVPFNETVALDVQGLPAGTYTVMADGLSQTFTLAVDNVLPGAPDLSGASLTVNVISALPGALVTLTGSGFPANTMIQIGIGPVNSEYEIIASVQSGADGRFTTQVALPATVVPGQQWVFVAVANNAAVLANPITIVGSDGTGSTPNAGVNVPVNGLFSQTYMYLIALEDAGQSGPAVGCNDSVVPVVIDIEPTAAPLTAALNRLLSLKEPQFGQSGLYNALYQSNLTLQSATIVNREAIISLSGELLLGGICDDPRLQAQLEYTALQYDTVDTVTILLNGQPLPTQINGRG